MGTNHEHDYEPENDPITGRPFREIRIEEFLADPKATLEEVSRHNASFQIMERGHSIAYLVSDIMVPDE